MIRLQRILPAALLWCAAVAGAMMPEERIDFADGLKARGLLDLAVREYRAFLDAHPEHPETPRVTLRLAEAFRAQGEVRTADTFYQRVIREFPDHAVRHQAEFRRAELYVEVGQVGDAANLFEALLTRDPPEAVRAAAAYYRGYCLARLGRAGPAEDALRAMLASHPEAPHADPARLELAALLRDDGRKEDAIALYREASRSQRPAVAAEAVYQRARLAFETDDMAGAASLFERLLREYRDDPRAAESVRLAAWAFQRDGRHAAVLELAAAHRSTEAAEQAEWAYLTANSRRRLMDFDGALRDYDRVLEQDPDGPFADSAAYEGALLALERRAHTDAIRRATAAGLDGEAAPDLHWILALAHAAEGDEARSIQFLQRLIERYPVHPRAGDAGYRLGRLLVEQGKWAEAAAVFREFVEKHPDHSAVAPALLAAGYACERLEDMDAALSNYTRLIERRAEAPWLTEALLRRSRALVRMGREAQAQASFLQLLEAATEGPAAVEGGYWVGLLHEKAGDAPAAETALRAARALAGPGEWGYRIDLALAGVVQQQGRDDEAAGLIGGLLGTPMQRHVAPSLLEWLTRRRLSEGDFAAASVAAEAWQDHPSADPASRSRARLLRGRALASGDGENEAALALLKEGLAAHRAGRDAIEARLLLADLLFAQERWVDARSAYEAAVEHAAGDADMDVRARGLFGLGRSAERAEEWDAAARFFMGVAILFDDNELSPHALYRASRCYQALQQDDAAAAASRELAERYPESPWVERLQDASP